MKKKFLLSAFISIVTINIQAQIHSTAVGGYWNEPGTWAGNVIPGSGNDVIIVGPVILAFVSGYNILTEYCNSLNITSTGSLKNGDYGVVQVYIQS